ncbi:hypothetical protein [Variovorax sp. GB1P17]|uniref:hypothetical protein n=1 Tax=Variovorax sp. GB1P17 TaxID=3443740 RepID=UPI003F47AFD5
MSPHELWRSASAATSIRFPTDPSELDVVCSDAVTCNLTTKGIELDNCMFNSDHLQAILRQTPREPNSKAVSMSVQVRLNRSLMAFIWVMDPRSKERLQVPNTDRVKATLSAFQVKLACALQRKAGDHGQKITISQAIKRARDSARALENAKTQSARRNVLKLMGLPDEESSATTDASSSASARRKSSSKRSTGTNKRSTIGALPGPLERPPTRSHGEEDIPSFTTVVRAPQTLVGHEP